jgi:hypothetical protein
LRRLLPELATLLFFLLAAVAMTWPLAATLSTAVPDHGDAYVSTLVMRWVAHALVTDAALFELPIFHPARHALAFSEHLIGIALPLVPLYAAGAEPLFVHNLGILLGFALTGYGASVLGRVATGARPGAIVAGLFFAFLPYRFNHIAQISYVTAGWLALMFAAWLHWTREPTRNRAALFGAAFFMNGLACLHWLVLGSLALAFAAPVAIAFHAPLRKLRAWMPIAIATAIATLALAPILWPYVQVRRLYAMERSIEETVRYSARLADWLVPPFHIAYGSLVNDGSIDPERWLFPGLVPLFIVLAGAASRSRRALLLAAAFALLTLAYLRFAAVVPLRLDLVSRAFDFSGAVWIPLVAGALCAIAALRYRWAPTAALVTAAVWIVTGFVLSLGATNPLFRALFELVSPLRGIRAPARWSMIVFAGIAILIAIAIGNRLVLAVVASVFLLAEQWAPNRLVHAPSRPSLTTRWLATAQFDGGVLQLPPGRYREMREAATHLRPIVGGVSSFEPAHRGDLERHAGIVVGKKPPGDAFTHVRRFCGEDVFARQAIAFAEQCDTPSVDVIEPKADVRGALRIEVRSNAKAVSARIGSGRLIVPLVNLNGIWSATIAKRPNRIHRDTDIQLEADGVRMEGSFLTWRRATELRWYDWRSPATWEIARRLGAPDQLGRELLTSRAPANVLARATLRAGRGLDDAGFRDFAISALVGRRVALDIRTTDREALVFAILESEAFARANLKP